MRYSALTHPWYILKVGGSVVSETCVFTDVLIWSTVYLQFGLSDVQIFCTLKEFEE